MHTFFDGQLDDPRLNRRNGGAVYQDRLVPVAPARISAVNVGYALTVLSTLHDFNLGHSSGRVSK